MPLPSDEKIVTLANELVGQLQSMFGPHPGFRPAHAKGILGTGRFQPARTAATLTKAPHANRPSTPVSVRFSDSTGIPPRFAKPAGFAQETYGIFDGPAAFGLYNDGDAHDFKALFSAQPSRELAFRYGYPDRDGHAHMIVTARSPARAP